MTAQGVLALAITTGAFVLFVWDRFRPDVVALLVATALIITGLVTPAEGVSGFSNEATITVALMLVISAGLMHTGVIDTVAARVVRLAGGSEWRLLLWIILVVIPLSAIINNTAAVAILMPAVLGATRQIGAAPSRLLMPLSFASQLGGALTLIGTSTNLLVAGLYLDLGLGRIRIFDITPPALAVAAAGTLYLLTLGRWLTPVRPEPRDLLDRYELHEYLAGLHVPPGSALAGLSIAESDFGRARGLEIVRIERRAGEVVVAPGGSTVLRAGDRLFVQGRIQEITSAQADDLVEVEGSDPRLPQPDDTTNEDDPVRLAEVLVPPRSTAGGRTLRSLGLRSRYGVSALALRRHGQPLHQPIGEVHLRPGDILLVQGRATQLRRLHEAAAFSLVGAVELPPTRRHKIKFAVPIVAGVVLLAALEVLPIMVAAMAGAVAMLLSGTLKADEAYEEMDWMVVILLAGILPLGIALQKTGAATFIAGGVVAVAAPLGPYGLLAAVYLLTSVLTNVISNVAAAALAVPIAAAIADALGLSPAPFAVAVMFAASNAFLTPIGYQTNLFVYGPGGYRFVDFFRVGGPLSVISAVVAVLTIPVFFPLGG